MNTDVLEPIAGAGAATANTSTLPRGDGREGMPSCWQEINALANSSKYGVVLDEQQLLDALLAR
jgi:hypothetical protein